jgi:hypothetical protein
MDSDDEHDHLSIDSNATINRTSAVHHLKHQLTFLNEVATAATLQICSYSHILLLFCHLVPLWKIIMKRRGNESLMYIFATDCLLFSLTTPGVMTCARNNLGSLRKISFS